MKKRIFAFLLAMCLLFSLSPTAAAEATYSAWFRSEYLEMRDYLGIVPDSFTQMDLTVPISRGEICELAVPAFEKLSGNHISPDRTDYFTDTNDENIAKAYELGIVNGYTDGTFQPEKGLSRQEFFQVLVNFCNAAGYEPDAKGTLDDFKDGSNVAAWAMDAALICVSHGYVRGDDQKRLNPTSGVTRQETMAMFSRCYKGLEQYYLNVVTANFIVTASSLNIRSGPSTSSELLGALPGNTVVKANSTTSDVWYRFVYNGTVGYLYSEHLAPYSGDVPVAGAASEKATQIVNHALQYLGYAYVWGGTSPSIGFDCSGLVYYVYRQYGINMYRVADDQMNQGTPVAKADLAIGDLLFWGYGDYADHIGIYIGNGNFLHASNPRSGVRISSMSETYYANKYLGARRVIQ